MACFYEKRGIVCEVAAYIIDVDYARTAEPITTEKKN